MSSPDLAAPLMDAAARWAGDQQATTVSIPLPTSHPWAERLGELGFRPRDTASVVVHASCRSGLEAAGRYAQWLMAGDADC